MKGRGGKVFDLKPERINLKNHSEREEVEEFLSRFDLLLDKDVDYTLVVRDKENIIATCSKAKNVFKCFAVSESLRGEGITATLISALTDRLFEEGMYHSFIFTRPDKESIFTALNYKTVESTDEAVLLENGIYGIENYLKDMTKKYNIDDSEKGAVVMNCNPLTKGHLYLIEKAAVMCGKLLIFIVQEDKSVFPFDARYELVRKASGHLKNVTVIPGSEYIISQATFPSYFIKEKNTKLKTYTELDSKIFGRYFGKGFNIKQRFVGTEPYCGLTDVYNDTLKKIMPQYGISLCQIDRLQVGGKAISASRVREYIKSGNMDELKELLPEVTMEFLHSDAGKRIVKKIRNE